MSQSELTNRQWRMASRPVGYPAPDDFELVEAPVQDPRFGEILVQNLYLSLDPYMRGRMRDRASYAANIQVGGIIVGETVGRVVASQYDGIRPGDYVTCNTGWQEYSTTHGNSARKVDPGAAPVSTALGVLGMPGLTAYHGLLQVGQPRPGDTVLVSAASGAVGGVVGQLAGMSGCRTIGTVGSDEKARYIVDELGYDVAINYKTDDVPQRLADAAPDGIDVYFDNVGGPVTDAAIDHLALRGRVLVCGQISMYNDESAAPGPRNLWALIAKQARIEGFLVFNFAQDHDVARARLTEWVASGRLQYKEDIVEGFENAPRAFIGLMNGANFGKLLVKIAD